MNANFYRENGSLNKGTSASGCVAVDDTFTMTIERIGQAVNVTVTYGGKTLPQLTPISILLRATPSICTLVCSRPAEQ